MHNIVTASVNNESDLINARKTELRHGQRRYYKLGKKQQTCVNACSENRFTIHWCYVMSKTVETIGRLLCFLFLVFKNLVYNSIHVLNWTLIIVHIILFVWLLHHSWLQIWINSSNNKKKMNPINLMTARGSAYRQNSSAYSQKNNQRTTFLKMRRTFLGSV